MALLDFSATGIVPSTPLDVLPPGRYQACIRSSEQKLTRNGRGAYLEMMFEIVAGEHQGRKVWTRLNLQNENTQTVEIAKRDLAAICCAVGIMNIHDSSELHDKVMTIFVRNTIRQDTGEKQSEIRGYAPPEPVTPSIKIPSVPVAVPSGFQQGGLLDGGLRMG